MLRKYIPISISINIHWLSIAYPINKYTNTHPAVRPAVRRLISISEVPQLVEADLGLCRLQGEGRGLGTVGLGQPRLENVLGLSP